MPGLLRAFGVGLAVSLGIPVVLLLLGATLPVFAVWYAYGIAPVLVYAFPAFFLVVPEHLTLALWGSVAQMCLLSAAFALLTFRRRFADQWLLAFAGFGLWWLLCRLLLGLAGLQPAFQARM